MIDEENIELTPEEREQILVNINQCNIEMGSLLRKFFWLNLGTSIISNTFLTLDLLMLLHTQHIIYVLASAAFTLMVIRDLRDWEWYEKNKKELNKNINLVKQYEI